MRRLPGLVLVALLAVPAAGCLQMLQTRSGIRADPVTVERQGEAVFDQYGIPVAERVADNRVESGWFAVTDFWGEDVIRERVDCGLDAEGRPVAVTGTRIEMSVTLKVAYRNTGTKVSVSSTGRTVPSAEDQDARRCRLSDPFVQELLAAVAGDFPTVGPAGDEPWTPGTDTTLQ